MNIEKLSYKVSCLIGYINKTLYFVVFLKFNRGLQNLWWEFDSLIPCIKKP